MRGRRDVGIALSARGISAWLPDGDDGDDGAAWERPLPPYDEESGQWPELASALRELPSVVGHPLRMHVALVPPTAQFRCLPLPRMSERELHRLLRRDLVRYFPVTGENVVGAAAPPRGRPGLPAAAAVAPAGLLHALEEAARNAGAEVERIVPAHAAWVAAAQAAWPILRTGRAMLLVAGVGRMEVLRLDEGWPTVHRRLARGSLAAERLGEALATPDDAPRGRVAFIGDRAPWEGAIAAVGVEPLAGAPGGWTPALTAARFAIAARGPELVSDDVRARRAAFDRRWAMRLGAASLVCLALAGGVELWSVSREATLLERRRTTIRQSVQRAVAARDTATLIADRLVSIASVRDATPRWSALLKTLAQRLPDDAYLVSLRAEGDSVSLEGVAASAADVIAALRETPGLSAVRADAPIRQELGAGGALVERFAVTLQLAPPDVRPNDGTVARRDAP